jgi:hypothetical protein
MAQLDYLFKKFIENKVKTDSSGTVISAANEPNLTSSLVKPENVWIETPTYTAAAGSSPASFQNASARMVKMTSIYGVGPTRPLQSLTGFAWRSDTTNWIDESYNVEFRPVFYVAVTTATAAEVLASPSTISASTSNFTFDYKTGILTFLGTVPTQPLSLTDPELVAGINRTVNTIWIKGYVYTGKTLADPGPKGILTGSTSSINFDGGAPDTVYTIGPVFDCGGVV